MAHRSTAETLALSVHPENEAPSEYMRLPGTTVGIDPVLVRRYSVWAFWDHAPAVVEATLRAFTRRRGDPNRRRSYTQEPRKQENWE